MLNPDGSSKSLNPQVVALVYDGLCAFEFSCVAEVFGLARPELGAGWYRFATCAANGRHVSGQYGMSMRVDGGLERLLSAGTIVIPGWQGIHAPVPPGLRTPCAGRTRAAPVCCPFVPVHSYWPLRLARQRQATTHWRYAGELQRRFPQIRVNPRVLYVDEGQILSSAVVQQGWTCVCTWCAATMGPAMQIRWHADW